MVSLRVLLDTSSYDRYLATIDFDRLVRAVETRRAIIYGFKIVRDELRAVPTTKKIGTKSLRMEILRTYDQLIGEHFYPNTAIIEQLATEYYQEYRGNETSNEMRNDFQIVACATIHQLDILVTQDRRTMISEDARRAYEIANRKNKLETPAFLSVEIFNKLL